jgi:hypothetical protein
MSAFSTDTLSLDISTPTFVCPNKDCGVVLRLEAYFPHPYFSGKKSICPSCKKSFDLWEYVVLILKQKAHLFRNRGAVFIGGRETHFTFQLPPNQTAEVDLGKFGVPEDAKIIYIACTPRRGAGFPLEGRGNQLLPHRTNHKLVFFGRPLPLPDLEVKNEGRHDVYMSVTYIPKTVDQVPFENMATSFEYFLSDNFDRMVLPSAVALEYAIDRLTTELLGSVDLPNTLNPTKRISLEVIIPLYCRLYNMPRLDARIVGLVVKLWKLIDDLARKGILKQPLQQTDSAHLLAAAMFCLNYLVHLKALVRPTESQNA